MVRHADFDATLGGEATRQPQHFGAVRLHRKVSYAAWIGFSTYCNAPSEYGLLFTPKQRVVLDAVGQLADKLCVDWNTDRFHPCNGHHVAAPQEGEP